MMQVAVGRRPVDKESFKGLTVWQLEQYKSLETEQIGELLANKKSAEFEKASSHLKELEKWPKNWDECGARKPKKDAITHAEKIIQTIFELSEQLKFGWKFPNITASSKGEVLLEWWVRKRKLSFYIDSKIIYFIKVGGAKIADMEDGELKELNLSSFKEIFGWLNDGLTPYYIKS